MMLNIVKTINVECRIYQEGLILIIKCPECPKQEIAMEYVITTQKYVGTCPNCHETYVSWDKIK